MCIVLTEIKLCGNAPTHRQCRNLRPGQCIAHGMSLCVDTLTQRHLWKRGVGQYLGYGVCGYADAPTWHTGSAGCAQMAYGHMGGRGGLFAGIEYGNLLLEISLFLWIGICVLVNSWWRLVLKSPVEDSFWRLLLKTCRCRCTEISLGNKEWFFVVETLVEDLFIFFYISYFFFIFHIY